eukprot:TRINITY_DN3957_c1_g1_i1.p1 TRINITY_DN3957_c1_g1~~TRINITY_DN3957_c1_g1_i1.p1  ORF type:complete len:385 (+),score=109.73 TRINITY_DN3957_c1_g1_i1:50-1204(+)
MRRRHERRFAALKFSAVPAAVLMLCWAFSLTELNAFLFSSTRQAATSMPILAKYTRAQRSDRLLSASAQDDSVAEAAPAEAAVVEEEDESQHVLAELLDLAAQRPEDLEARVEEVFADIAPEDLSELHLKLSADSDKAAAQAVSAAIQVAVQGRMRSAKTVLEDLIATADGDVNIRIRKALKAQESPLPMLMVLQLSMGQAQTDGDAEKLRVLMHIHTVINEELEKKVSRVRSLLNKILRIEDVNIRDNLLRHHLTPTEVPGAPDFDDDDDDSSSGKLMAALVTPSRLASAMCQLVSDVDRQMVAVVGQAAEDRFKSMDRIRQVAKEARLVIGDVYGEGEMNTFGADLTPAFHILMAHKANQATAAAAAKAQESAEAEAAQTSK